jgi:TonB family protein
LTIRFEKDKYFSLEVPVPSTRALRFRGRLPLCVSLAAHGLVAALLVPVGMHLKTKLKPSADEYQIAMVEVAGGSALPKLPLLIAPNGDRNAEKQGPESRPSATVPPQKRHLHKASGSQAQMAREQDRGTSSAAGNGSDARDATFAFPVFSPKPPIADRALLPSVDRQVVLDVKLNTVGEVIGENLVRGIGNALDQIALETVKSWRFQPATVNGQPVPSEAEVIFTFGPHYPITPS